MMPEDIPKSKTCELIGIEQHYKEWKKGAENRAKCWLIDELPCCATLEEMDGIVSRVLNELVGNWNRHIERINKKSNCAVADVEATSADVKCGKCGKITPYSEYLANSGWCNRCRHKSAIGA